MGGSSGNKIEIPKVQAKQIGTGQLSAQYNAAGNLVESTLNASATKLERAIREANEKAAPYEQLARESTREIGLMSGLPTTVKTKTMSLGEMSGRLKDFGLLLSKATPEGTAQLSGDEIANRYRKTEGYQATMGAGKKAMAESGIADRISRGDGATDAALTFGSKMMDMTLQSHIDRLTQIANLTVPVALQQYQKSLNDSTEIYNAQIAGGVNKAQIQTDLAALKQGAREFNVTQQLQANMANNRSDMAIFQAMIDSKRDPSTPSGGINQGGYVPGTGSPGNHGYSPYIEQTARGPGVVPNPYAVNPKANPYDVRSTQSPAYMTDSGPLAGLFGGLF